MSPRTRLWNQILDLDRAVRYFQAQGDRYEKRHKWASWLIVGLALGAAGAQMVETVAYVPMALFIATAGLSAWVITSKESDYAVAAKVYTSEYQRLREEAMDLWFQLDVSGQLVAQLGQRAVVAASGVTIPVNRKLNQKCTEETYAAIPHELAA